MDKSIPALPSTEFVDAKIRERFLQAERDRFASLFNKTCRMDYLIDHQVAVKQHQRWVEEARRLQHKESRPLR